MTTKKTNVLFYFATLSLLWMTAGSAEERLPFLNDEGLVTSTRTGNQTVPDGVDLADFTSSDPAGPAIDADDVGNSVIVWTDETDGSDNGIFCRGFTSGGTELFAEFRVNSATTGVQENPHVAVDADGDFVVAWESDPTGTDLDVYVRGFNSDGSQRFAEFRVNTITAEQQEHPRLDMMANGDFIIVWDSGIDETVPGNKEAKFRRFNANGTDVDVVDQAANVWTTGNQRFPDAAFDENGGFVISWQSGAGGTDIFQDGDISGIFARIWNSAGTPQAITNLPGQCFDLTTATQEICVNDYKGLSQDLPRVARRDAGEFVIVWHSDGSNGAAPPGASRTLDSSEFSNQAKRFESNGDAKAPSWQVNSFTLSEQVFPDLTMAANGAFAITWSSIFQAVPPASQAACVSLDFGAILGGLCDAISEVYAEEYNFDGTVKHAEFMVNTGSADINGTMTALNGVQVYTSVDVADSSGDMLFAWSSGPPPAPFPGAAIDMQDGSGWGALGRRGGHLGVAGELFSDDFEFDGFAAGSVDAWSSSTP